MMIVLFVLILFLWGMLHKRSNDALNAVETSLGILYVFSYLLFAIGMAFHSNPYYKAIDPSDAECYSLFSDKHVITLIVYFLAFNISAYLVWTKSELLPPLTLALSLVFILIGIIVSSTILVQIAVHNTNSLGTYNSGEEQIPFLFAPLLSIVVGSWLLFQTMSKQVKQTETKTYSNKCLNILNAFFVTRSKKPLWIVILLFPVFFIVTLLLMLVGQDVDSVVKLFTDTTTWRLSQQMHPPTLDHKGHYLCTVAVSGNPKIVKPLRFGQRNGKQIIVNRQLLIANAFEELIQDFSPKLHQLIRRLYDRYGFNLSKKINTAVLSNVTYLLMKPLEWFFLICLYLFCCKPEEKINRQYTEHT